MDDTFVYVVDTANLWNTHGSLSEAEALPYFEAEVGAAEATATAGVAIASASAIGATAAVAEGQTALRFCMRYLGTTQTYSEVVQGGRATSVRGHWLVLVYRFGDGTTTLRPAFVALDGAGAVAKLDPARLLQLLLKVVESDMHGDSGLLRSRDQGHGGLRLAAALASRLTQH